MKYGKIYFHDRFGNKVQDEEPDIKEEVHHFSINSPRIKVHANVPFDENQVTTGQMSGRLTTQDLITFDQPSLPAELDDINFGPVDSPLAIDRGYSLNGDRQLRQRSAYNQVFTPLNDLRDPEDPKDELARQMDKIDLNKLPTIGPYDSVFEDELCEDCRVVGHNSLEARRGLRSEVDVNDSGRLRYKLREHVDGINWDQMHGLRRHELLPMDVLPPFANRLDERSEKAKKERYRIEFEDEINKKRQIELEPSESNQYAKKEEEQKIIELINTQKDVEFNRTQAELRKRQAREEDNQVEWWETRSQFDEYKHDRNRKHYADQLRRNEMLKQNVEQLQQFENKFKQQREANHMMRYQQLKKVRDETVTRPELTRPEAARHQRELLDSVWNSWVEAHRLNDKRYRVLQEYDARRHRAIQPAAASAHVECDVKRCRRCRRPIAKRVAFVN